MKIINCLNSLHPGWNSWHDLSSEMDELTSIYDPINKILLVEILHKNSLTLTLRTLECIYQLQLKIIRHFDKFPKSSPHYIIWTSAIESIFCLGLDLKYILELIKHQDESNLRQYIQRCADVLFINYHNLELPVINIAVINGNAFGGGIDFALSSDVVFAKDGIDCGLSTSEAGILPSVGLPYYFFKFNGNDLEEKIINQNTQSLDQLLKNHAVNYHYKDDPGQVLSDFISRSSEHFLTYACTYRVKKKSSQLKQSFINDFINMWLASALNLTTKEILGLEKMAEIQAKSIMH